MDTYSTTTLHCHLMSSLRIILELKIGVNRKEHEFFVLVQTSTRIEMEINLCETKVIHM